MLREPSHPGLYPCVGPEGQSVFAGLYQAYSSLVRREIRRWTRSISLEDLQDLEQDVWRGAWRGLARFEARASAATWLTSIVRHIVFSWLRRERIKKLARTRLVEAGGQEPAVCPEDFVQPLLFHLSLVDAMGRLDQRFADAIRLRYFEQLSDVEAARRLALPLGTVKRRIRSGLKHLRSALDELSAVPVNPLPVSARARGVSSSVRLVARLPHDKRRCVRHTEWSRCIGKPPMATRRRVGFCSAA
jgi:RNA polymerase sigma-70 factor (ECF subfamily)